MSDQVLRVAEDAARAAGAVLLRRFRGRLEVRQKGRFDPVTDADEEAEAALLAVIRAAFPDHATLGEESGSRGESSDLWIADALDGTLNFIRGVPAFAVSVAYTRGGTPVAGAVLDPVRGELWSARAGHGLRLNGAAISAPPVAESLAGAFVALELGRARIEDQRTLATALRVREVAAGVRVLGSTALGLAYTAAGRTDLFLAVTPSAWDVAGGWVLCEAAGRRVVSPGAALGDRALGLVAAGSPGAVQEMLALRGA